MHKVMHPYVVLMNSYTLKWWYSKPHLTWEFNMRIYWIEICFWYHIPVWINLFSHLFRKRYAWERERLEVEWLKSWGSIPGRGRKCFYSLYVQTGFVASPSQYMLQSRWYLHTR
jgi:hypothetical protein